MGWLRDNNYPSFVDGPLWKFFAAEMTVDYLIRPKIMYSKENKSTSSDILARKLVERHYPFVPGPHD